MPNKIFILTGELSGDIHAANLVKSLRTKDKSLSFRAWGGDHLRKAKVEVVKDIKELAFMGFVEVVKNLRTILGNFSLCKAQITAFNPDLLVLVDYPGFNLRMAKWAKKEGIPICYYIAPQAWAWKKSRVVIMQKVIDKLLVILPFEKAFFSKHNINTVYVGHPLLDELKKKGVRKPEVKTSVKRNKLALLPGSRQQEIKKMLPIMLQSAKTLGYKEILLAKANNIDTSFIQSFLGDQIKLNLVNIHTALKEADFALVSSGTATLETALYGVPQIVCYKGNPISYTIAKRIVDIKYISLVNLILDRLVVPELIQDQLHHDHIINQHKKITDNADDLNNEYRNLWDLLDQGSASQVAARHIINLL